MCYESEVGKRVDSRREKLFTATAGKRRLLLLQHSFPEFVCGNEHGCNPVWNLNFMETVRSTDTPALSLDRFPDTKTAQFNAVAVGNRLHYKGQKAVNDGLGFNSGETNAIGKFVHQLLFGHSATHSTTPSRSEHNERRVLSYLLTTKR